MIISYQNINISYKIYGTGFPIVFLHGFLENKEMWQPFLPYFNQFQAVTIDLLGHGETGVLSNIHTMEDQAVMIAFVLDKLQINQAFFIGHSMGGYVALALLEKNPILFKGVILQNSTTKADSQERKNIRTRFNHLIDNNFDVTINMSIANLFSSNFREKHKNIINQTQKEALKTTIQGIKAAQEGMKARKDTTEIWKKSNILKFLILGTEDEILDYKTTREIAQDHEIFLLPSGHMSHLEDQEKLIKVYQKIFFEILNF
ncbi:MAG: alpha/beta fold hydrolase [Flavobacterium sp.]